MDKSKLNWGLMSGIYPTAYPGTKYNPAGLGDSLVTRQAGQTDDKAQRPRRPVHTMVGRFTRKGIRNIPI